jgi:Permuted papain-like amidase enzyme, YaeF/YiiX, C92 family
LKASSDPRSCIAHRCLNDLRAQCVVGDLVFIRVRTPLFMQVAEATGSWTNHVGVVIDNDGTIAESRFPLSGTTTLSRFVRQSAGGRVALARLRRPLQPAEQRRVAVAARRRTGVVYDTGFNLHSRRQFCSRYAREVIGEATGEQLGQVETFSDLLHAQPNAALWFWTLWYFGRIPWQRQTVTPASVLRSAAVELVFDGYATTDG